MPAPGPAGTIQPPGAYKQVMAEVNTEIEDNSLFPFTITEAAIRVFKEDMGDVPIAKRVQAGTLKQYDGNTLPPWQLRPPGHMRTSQNSPAGKDLVPPMATDEVFVGSEARGGS